MAKRALILTPLLVLLSASCVDGYVGGGKRLRIEGDAFPDAATQPAPAFDDAGNPIEPVEPIDGGVIPNQGPKDAGGVEPPVDAGQVLRPFASASMGPHCVGAGTSTWLVLSAAADCGAHAGLVASPGTGVGAAVELPAFTAPASVSVLGDVCLTDGLCEARTIDLEIDSFTAGTGATGRWSITLPEGRAEGELSPSWCLYDDFIPGGAGLVAELAVDEVAVYQSVRVPVVEGGAEVPNRNAPIVANREGLLRIFVAPGAGWATRDVVARLSLERPGASPLVLEETISVSQASQETVPASTFNFDIPAEAMVPDLSYSVGLYESSGCGGGGDTSGARFPETSVADLGAESMGDTLSVVVVPVRYDADGSGRLPDTSPTQMQAFENVLYSMFPVAAIDLTVRAEPMPFDVTLARTGAGWTELLQGVLNLRQDDGVPSNVYYYGLFAPAASFNNFCQGGCVAGLGPVPPARDEYSRGSIGLGFPGGAAPGTFAHELGHALGRLHAPCGTQNPDPNFPYQGGITGVWGFDPVNRTLISPTQTTDFMGYCNPTWISDYNYGALFSRVAYVNQNAEAVEGQQQVRTEWDVAIDDPDGLRWGKPVSLASWPAGEPLAAVYRDALGEVVQSATAYAYPLSHIDGQLILVPHLAGKAAAVDLAAVGQLPLK